LGSWFLDPVLQARHDAIVAYGKFDMFLPHPADSRSAVLKSNIVINEDAIDLDLMIAEDIIAGLIRSGYRPIVYGFNSTVLVNLARFVPTLSIVIASNQSAIADEAMVMLGVRRINCLH
jgi:hypothetical protein